MTDKRFIFLLAIPPIAGLAFSLWASHGAVALPMDDAYILRQYAYNLAHLNGWGFNAGEVSFGTTSLFWPLMNALPMALIPSLSYEITSWFLGILSFAALIGLVEYWVWREVDNLPLAILAGLLTAISPTGYMNAVSGMESIFFAMVMAASLAVYRFSGLKRAGLLGVMAGAAFLTRPEGLYLALAIPGAELIGRIRNKGKDIRGYVFFLAGFAALALPYVIFIRLHSPGWLPTTYAGKIISSDPFMHRFGPLYDLAAGLMALFKSHWRAVARYGLAAPALWAAAAAYSAVILAGVFRNQTPHVSAKAAWSLCAMALLTVAVAALSLNDSIKILLALVTFGLLISLVLSLWFLARAESSGGESIRADKFHRLPPLMGVLVIPVAYGALFRAGPLFGGYYERYITPLLPAMVIMGISGVGWFYVRIKGVAWKSVASIGIVLLFVYPLIHTAGRLPEHRSVYQAEAALNAGLRLKAARWLRDNTPREAVIFIGYTGLGVVGSYSERYVLDMGALINPDIFPYYRDVPAAGRKKWKRTLKYIADRKVDYFVTVPGNSDDPFSNPAGEPGFFKVAALRADKSEGGISAIEIWRIDRGRLRVGGPD